MSGRRNRHIWLALCVLFFVTAGRAYGDLPEWLNYVWVNPPNPTSNDVVSITLSGGWGDVCIPNGSFIWLSGNDIYFEVFRDYPPGIVCAQVVSGWEQTQSIGHLSPGVYTLYAGLDGSYTEVAQFTVSGPPGPAERHVPSEYSTIQAAINACNNGDIVIIAAGTYTGAGNRDIDFLGKAITVSSINPDDPCVIAATIIDCNGTVENPHRGFHFHSSEHADSVLNGFTIINGYVTYDLGSAGGAIYCENESSPTIINCIITGNKATSWPLIGGGSGGAISGHNGEIGNCLISENSATFGGGLSQCGGIIRNNIITNNKADYLGGGLSSCDGAIHNNVISHNYTVGAGGGLAYCSAYYIHHNIIAYNTAPFGTGGGLYYCDGNIKNNTIYANSTLNGGGGLADCSGNVSNCVVWSNLPDQIRNVAAVRYSDVQNGWAGEGNIDADPCFADPAGGDYHLESQSGRWDPATQSWVQNVNTSPCIDAGDPNSDWTKELWPNGKRINMGVYGGTPEASMSLSTVGNIANLDNDPCDTIDFNDLAVFVEKWLYEEVLLSEDLDRNGIVNFVDYAIFAQQWPGALFAAEPGIEYEISPCNGGLSATEQLDETRFTVTVEGSNIHFEDMMRANCCATDLWLEMDVINNLITIHEHEYGEYLCLCICDYPVTATLGPFEPGIYTLAVYEDWGGFIGSTTVTVE
jgi:hypothetical protein